uniref:Uncharacterized protein n=1 Tax=Ascaris lumbricoides TaxID=6252 RepID=A0A0M3HR07_ASCLU
MSDVEVIQGCEVMDGDRGGRKEEEQRATEVDIVDLRKWKAKRMATCGVKTVSLVDDDPLNARRQARVEH